MIAELGRHAAPVLAAWSISGVLIWLQHPTASWYSYAWA